MTFPTFCTSLRLECFYTVGTEPKNTHDCVGGSAAVGNQVLIVESQQLLTQSAMSLSGQQSLHTICSVAVQHSPP